MRACSILFTLITALALFGCSGKKLEAKAPEKDPWADYKGTYASGSPAPDAKSGGDKTEKTASTKSADTADADAKPTKKGSKPKKGAAPSEPKTAAADSSAPSADPDARSMYNETSGKPEDTSTDAAPKKVAKKRAGGGKKAGGKKAAKPKT